ncbi:MAG: GH92 family glycosyl hydrolase [Clostridia bacterium]|nr:GH92 family glycosyl hydrolase [Clostridia bacterium]
MKHYKMKWRCLLAMFLVLNVILSLIGCDTPTASLPVEPTGTNGVSTLVNTDHINEQNAISYNKEKNVKWSTSFETTDGFVGDIVHVENIGEYKDTSLRDGDAVSLILKSEIDASPVMTQYGSIDALFDHDNITKYITEKNPSVNNPVYITMPLKQAFAVNWYTITSANDVENRDPRDWVLYGSNNGEQWEIVHEIKDYDFPARQQTHLFKFDNDVQYCFYKLVITRTGGEYHTQIGGFRLGCGSGEYSIYTKEHTLNAQFSPNLPAETGEIRITLEESQVVNRYSLISNDNDCTQDPYSWTLYASDNNKDWTELHSEDVVNFSSRGHEYIVDIDNTVPYKYYKLKIHKAAYAATSLLKGVSLGYYDWRQGDPEVSVGNGASVTWGSVANKGWTGQNALMLAGAHLGKGEAYAEVVLYSGLNITVDADTYLDYKIFPDFANEYDYDYTSQFVAIDILFTDGTRLSELDASDQYGFKMSAMGQGMSEVYYTKAWNEVCSNIGEVAQGKTIDKILAVYDKDYNNNSGNSIFRTYIDDVSIYTEKEIVTALSDYVNITRGTYPNTHVSSPTRGTCTPIVAVPHGFNHFGPVNNMYRLYTYHLEGDAKKMKHISLYHNPVAALGHYSEYSFMINNSINTATADVNTISYDNRGAEFSHENEISKAHYYSVVFDENSAASNCRIEVTPTEHAAMLRFTFDENSAYRNIIFDCPRGNGNIKFNADGSFIGYTDMKQEGVYYGDSGARRMYFYGYFDVAPGYSRSFGKSGIISFENADVVNMKVASSFISYEQAQKNLELEIGKNETFESVACRAKKAWEEILGRVEIEGATRDQLVTFYSCLYRTYLFPYAHHENIGTKEEPKYAYANPYKGTQTKPEITEGTLYSGYGVWDTYRNTHQLYSILTPEFTEIYAQGIIDHYKQYGWTPKYTVPMSVVCMNAGCDSILSDLAVKGIEFDYEEAYKALLKEVNCYNKDNLGRQGSNSYPYTYYMNMNVSSNLEYALGDYSLSKFAQMLGKEDEAEYFLNRSKAYINSFVTIDGEGWFANGYAPNNNGWGYTFDPNNWSLGYCESNAWHICAYATHDIEGMITLYGGQKAFEDKLDKLFTTKSSICYAFDSTWAYMLEARECKMGQYNHGNEPGHALPYMYNYAGAPYKTQQYVREIMSRMYCGANMGGGYAGDEDSGELSAWYVLSALGFYPVELADNNYIIGSPLFKKVTVLLENGKKLVVTAENNSMDNVYIQSMKLNGESYDKFHLNHDDIINGAEIEFVMGDTPSDWATSADARPATCISQPGESPVIYTDILSGNRLKYENLTLEAKLVDDNNTSGGAICKGDTASVTVELSEAKAVRFVTITSAVGSAPDGFELFASNDGESWISIEKREGLVFEWDQYLRSFKVHSQDEYTSYKLVLTGKTGFETAEIELIG